MAGLLTTSLFLFRDQVCENEKLRIRCPVGTSINVQSAQFGRQVSSRLICPISLTTWTGDTTELPAIEDTNCLATSSLQVCNAHPHCRYHVLTAGTLHILTAGTHILTAGTHILAAGTHILTAGTHILPAGTPHILTAGTHILTAGTHILTAGTLHILAAGTPHILTAGSLHILTAGSLHILTAGTHILTAPHPVDRYISWLQVHILATGTHPSYRYTS